MLYILQTSPWSSLSPFPPHPPPPPPLLHPQPSPAAAASYSRDKLICMASSCTDGHDVFRPPPPSPASSTSFGLLHHLWPPPPPSSSCITSGLLHLLWAPPPPAYSSSSSYTGAATLGSSGILVHLLHRLRDDNYGWRSRSRFEFFFSCITYR
jgi:hypothetical protein